MAEERMMIEILRDFNARNEETNIVLDEDNQPMDIEKKTEFLSKIFVILQQTKDFEIKYEILRAIHYCVRDATGVLPLLSSQTIKTIKENFLIELNDENEEKEKIKNEALKCLVSISSLSEDLNHLHLNDLNLVKHLLSSLPDERIKDEKKKFYCQLLFRLCLISSLKQFILSQSIFVTLFNIYKTKNIKIKEEREVMTEILDLFYILSTKLGPIEGPSSPSPEQLLIFSQLKESLNRIMEIETEEIEYLHIKENTIKCFLNSPKNIENSNSNSDQNNNDDNNNDNNDHKDNLSHFLSFLLYHLKHPSNPKSKVVPVLILLSSIARSSNKKEKEFILNNVFPGWESFEADPPDAPKELQNKETAGGRLVSYMTSQSPVLSFCVSDFIFALCGDNGQAFAELVGMGNAFSLLSDRNLIDTVQSPHPVRRKDH